MLGNSEEIHPRPSVGHIHSPVLVFIKVNVSTKVSKFIRIVSMGQDVPRAIKWITKGKQNFN